MTVLAIVLAISLPAVVFLCLRHVQHIETAHALERRELLNRIQRPEYTPTSAAENFVMPEQTPDDWNLVGQIDYDEPAESDGD